MDRRVGWVDTTPKEWTGAVFDHSSTETKWVDTFRLCLVVAMVAFVAGMVVAS